MKPQFTAASAAWRNVCTIPKPERLASALMHREAPSPWMTIPEAASYLRTSRAQGDQMLSAKTLTRHNVGRKTLIARAQDEALVAD